MCYDDIPNNLPYLFKQTKLILFLLCYNLHSVVAMKFFVNFLKHSWICSLVGLFKTTYNNNKMQ